jgi:hypothetical protein
MSTNNQNQSTIPFFGRAWSLTITPSSGPSAGVPIVVTSDSFKTEALRMTFEISQFAFSAFWQAEIVLYNANGPITEGPSAGINLYKAVIQEGDMVTVSAGYQADYPFPAIPPAIWMGPVFYTLQDRISVVDQTLVIHCLLSRALTTQNFLNATLPARSTQFTQARFIAENAINKININQSQIETALSSVKTPRAAVQLPRAKTYFGNPHHYLTRLAEQNGLLSWFDAHTWNVDSLQQPIGKLVATYAPITILGGPPERDGKLTLSLIGQPQQTQLGINFRVLLDPNVQIVAPLCQVAVQQQYVRQAPIAYPPGQNQFPPLPLVDQYVVIGVRFSGDTRGNNWYTDITGASQILTAIQLLGNTSEADVTGN